MVWILLLHVLQCVCIHGFVLPLDYIENTYYYGSISNLEKPLHTRTVPITFRTSIPPFYHIVQGTYAPFYENFAQYLRWNSDFKRQFSSMPVEMRRNKFYEYETYLDTHEGYLSLEDDTKKGYDDIFQRHFLKLLYSIHGYDCITTNRHTTKYRIPNYLYQTPEFSGKDPCETVVLPLPTDVRVKIMEILRTGETLRLYLGDTGLRIASKRKYSSEDIRQCMKNAVTSPTTSQATVVSTLLKRNTVLNAPGDVYNWELKFYAVPQGIEKSILKILSDSDEYKLCLNRRRRQHEEEKPAFYSQDGNKKVTNTFDIAKFQLEIRTFQLGQKGSNASNIPIVYQLFPEKTNRNKTDDHNVPDKNSASEHLAPVLTSSHHSIPTGTTQQSPTKTTATHNHQTFAEVTVPGTIAHHQDFFHKNIIKIPAGGTTISEYNSPSQTVSTPGKPTTNYHHNDPTENVDISAETAINLKKSTIPVQATTDRNFLHKMTTIQAETTTDFDKITSTVQDTTHHIKNLNGITSASVETTTGFYENIEPVETTAYNRKDVEEIITIPNETTNIFYENTSPVRTITHHSNDLDRITAIPTETTTDFYETTYPVRTTTHHSKDLEIITAIPTETTTDFYETTYPVRTTTHHSKDLERITAIPTETTTDFYETTYPVRTTTHHSKDLDRITAIPTETTTDFYETTYPVRPTTHHSKDLERITAIPTETTTDFYKTTYPVRTTTHHPEDGITEIPTESTNYFYKTTPLQTTTQQSKNLEGITEITTETKTDFYETDSPVRTTAHYYKDESTLIPIDSVTNIYEIPSPIRTTNIPKGVNGITIPIDDVTDFYETNSPVQTTTHQSRDVDGIRNIPTEITTELYETTSTVGHHQENFSGITEIITDFYEAKSPVYTTTQDHEVLNEFTVIPEEATTEFRRKISSETAEIDESVTDFYQSTTEARLSKYHEDPEDIITASVETTTPYHDKVPVTETMTYHNIFPAIILKIPAERKPSYLNEIPTEIQNPSETTIVYHHNISFPSKTDYYNISTEIINIPAETVAVPDEVTDELTTAFQNIPDGNTNKYPYDDSTENVNVPAEIVTARNEITRGVTNTFENIPFQNTTGYDYDSRTEILNIPVLAEVVATHNTDPTEVVIESQNITARNTTEYHYNIPTHIINIPVETTAAYNQEFATEMTNHVKKSTTSYHEIPTEVITIPEETTTPYHREDLTRIVSYYDTPAELTTVYSEHREIASNSSAIQPERIFQETTKNSSGTQSPYNIPEQTVITSDEKKTVYREDILVETSTVDNQEIPSGTETAYHDNIFAESTTVYRDIHIESTIQYRTNSNETNTVYHEDILPESSTISDHEIPSGTNTAYPDNISAESTTVYRDSPIQSTIPYRTNSNEKKTGYHEDILPESSTIHDHEIPSGTKTAYHDNISAESTTVYRDIPIESTIPYRTNSNETNTVYHEYSLPESSTIYDHETPNETKTVYQDDVSTETTIIYRGIPIGSTIPYRTRPNEPNTTEISVKSSHADEMHVEKVITSGDNSVETGTSHVNSSLTKNISYHHKVIPDGIKSATYHKDSTVDDVHYGIPIETTPKYFEYYTTPYYSRIPTKSEDKYDENNADTTEYSTDVPTENTPVEHTAYPTDTAALIKEMSNISTKSNTEKIKIAPQLEDFDEDSIEISGQNLEITDEYDTSVPIVDFSGENIIFDEALMPVFINRFEGVDVDTRFNDGDYDDIWLRSGALNKQNTTHIQGNLTWMFPKRNASLSASIVNNSSYLDNIMSQILYKHVFKKTPEENNITDSVISPIIHDSLGNITSKVLTTHDISELNVGKHAVPLPYFQNSGKMNSSNATSSPSIQGTANESLKIGRILESTNVTFIEDSKNEVHGDNNDDKSPNIFGTGTAAFSNDVKDVSMTEDNTMENTSSRLHKTSLEPDTDEYKMSPESRKVDAFVNYQQVLNNHDIINKDRPYPFKKAEDKGGLNRGINQNQTQIVKNSVDAAMHIDESDFIRNARINHSLETTTYLTDDVTTPYTTTNSQESTTYRILKQTNSLPFPTQLAPDVRDTTTNNNDADIDSTERTTSTVEEYTITQPSVVDDGIDPKINLEGRIGAVKFNDEPLKFKQSITDFSTMNNIQLERTNPVTLTSTIYENNANAVEQTTGMTEIAEHTETTLMSSDNLRTTLSKLFSISENNTDGASIAMDVIGNDATTGIPQANEDFSRVSYNYILQESKDTIQTGSTTEEITEDPTAAENIRMYKMIQPISNETNDSATTTDVFLTTEHGDLLQEVIFTPQNRTEPSLLADVKESSTELESSTRYNERTDGNIDRKEIGSNLTSLDTVVGHLNTASEDVFVATTDVNVPEQYSPTEDITISPTFTHGNYFDIQSSGLNYTAVTKEQLIIQRIYELLSTLNLTVINDDDGTSDDTDISSITSQTESSSSPEKDNSSVISKTLALSDIVPVITEYINYGNITDEEIYFLKALFDEFSSRFENQTEVNISKNLSLQDILEKYLNNDVFNQHVTLKTKSKRQIPDGLLIKEGDIYKPEGKLLQFFIDHNIFNITDNPKAKDTYSATNPNALTDASKDTEHKRAKRNITEDALISHLKSTTIFTMKDVTETYSGNSKSSTTHLPVRRSRRDTKLDNPSDDKTLSLQHLSSASRGDGSHVPDPSTPIPPSDADISPMVDQFRSWLKADSQEPFYYEDDDYYTYYYDDEESRPVPIYEDEGSVRELIELAKFHAEQKKKREQTTTTELPEATENTSL